MKKAIIILIILVLVLGVGFFTVTALNSTTVTEGYSLKCENGSYMIIDERGSPIRYSYNKALGTDVEKLTDGDRILIISDLINESYPGSTSARFIFKLEDGEISDIPEATLRSLAELGWYKFTE
ncbi:MAG: hypothetical protein J6V06_03955 [Clostridia bacterium]|nr:hypothetical protein [Clostridia bacterium]